MVAATTKGTLRCLSFISLHAREGHILNIGLLVSAVRIQFKERWLHPTPAYLGGAILFGFVGFPAYRYGKKASRPIAKWIGIALMVYPYGVPETWLMYAVGLGLCTGLYWCRE